MRQAGADMVSGGLVCGIEWVLGVWVGMVGAWGVKLEVDVCLFSGCFRAA